MSEPDDTDRVAALEGQVARLKGGLMEAIDRKLMEAIGDWRKVQSLADATCDQIRAESRARAWQVGLVSFFGTLAGGGLILGLWLILR